MKIIIFILIFILQIFVAAENASDSVNIQKLKKDIKTGYFNFKSNVSFANIQIVFNVYVPENYDENYAYPVIIALHRKEGTGQEFMNLIQDSAKKHDFIVVCPDSENQYSWDTTKKSNKHILNEAYSYISTHYNIDNSKIFLLGHGEGAKYLIYLLTCSVLPNFINNVSGFIISGTEIQILFIDNRWKLPGLNISNHWKFPSSNIKIPILYLQSRSDTESLYSRARFTRDILLKQGFLVEYIEKESFDGYPIELNDKIFNWCLGAKKSINEIETFKRSAQVVTNEFEIKAIAFQRFDLEDTELKLKYRFGSKYVVSIKSLKNFDLDKKSDFKKIYNNISAKLKLFDRDKNLIYFGENRLTGFDPGDHDKREYLRKKYNKMQTKTEKQIEKENSIKNKQIVSVEFYPALDTKPFYAAAFVYKSGALAAFDMYPKNSNYLAFDELSNIVLNKESSEANPDKLIKIHDRVKHLKAGIEK